MSSIKEIAIDLINFTISNVNDAISFKPQLCYQVPSQEYEELREKYVLFTGTSIRKNKSKLYFLPTNISDELQQLNTSIPENAKEVPQDGHTYYKNRLITELDYENVKRVELACAYVAYAAINQVVNIELQSDEEGELDEQDLEKLSPAESTALALRRGGVLGFRELGHLVSITPWHFHRVFKVITGLTIREYGQLCCEFIKKNKDIMNACRKKVEKLKLQGDSYLSSDDPKFLEEGSLVYEPTENVVLLPEYFIDPNKSKENKKKHKESKNSDGKCPRRVEARKRRSTLMTGRIRRASQSSISSNSSIQDALNNVTIPQGPSTPQMFTLDVSSDYSDNSSTSSPTSLTSASMKKPTSRSRKNSVISTQGKVTKKKSISGHRRNFSDPDFLAAKSALKITPLEHTKPRLSSWDPSPSTPNSTEPQVDFKYNVFNSENLVEGNIDDAIPPHVMMDPQDSIVYNIGMLDAEPVRMTPPVINTSSVDSMKPISNDTSMTDIFLFNNTLKPEEQIYQNSRSSSPEYEVNASASAQKGNMPMSMPPKYTRNRMNSVVPRDECTDNFNRMFLSSFGPQSSKKFNPTALQEFFPSDIQTDANDTNALFTDACAAIKGVNSDEDMTAFEGYLGNETISPILSPSTQALTLDTELMNDVFPLCTKNVTAELLASHGNGNVQSKFQIDDWISSGGK